MDINEIRVKDRAYINIHPGEENSPIIIRDSVAYLNLDVKNNGKPMTFLNHTAMRSVVDEVD